MPHLLTFSRRWQWENRTFTPTYDVTVHLNFPTFELSNKPDE